MLEINRAERQVIRSMALWTRWSARAGGLAHRGADLAIRGPVVEPGANVEAELAEAASRAMECASERIDCSFLSEERGGTRDLLRFPRGLLHRRLLPAFFTQVHAKED